MTMLLQEHVEILWALDPEVMPPRQIKVLPVLRAWMAGPRAGTIGHFLTGQSPLPPLGKIKGELLDATNGLLVKFRSNVIPDIRPIDSAIAAIELFGKLIDRGNALKLFNLCPPPIPYLERRTPSPFEESRWEKRDVATALRAMLATPVPLGDLDQLAETTEELARIRLGHLLLSSIVHGGLINAVTLLALVRKLADLDRVIDSLGARVFVELSLEWRGQDDAEFRRWIPDPLSAMLIMYLPPDTLPLVKKWAQSRDGSSDENGTENPSDGVSKATDPEKSEETVITRKMLWRCIQDYFKVKRVSTANRPKSLSMLLDAVKLDLQTRLPPVLVSYASRDVISHSLKPDVWRRLHGYPGDSTRTRRDSSDEDVSSESGTFDTLPSAGAEPRWLLPLRTALAGADRILILGRLDTLLKKSPPTADVSETGQFFFRFAKHLMTTGRSGGKILTVSTVRSYALSAARRLGGILGSESVKQLSADEWATFYTEVLDDAESPGARRKLVRVLREFHRFLQSDLQVEAIEAREVFGIGDGLVPVDANILSPEDFDRIRHALEHPSVRRVDPEILQIADLIFTLAYRCGLRRMEVLKLELSDLAIKAPAELLVRPTESRRLKTKNSTRKMPLHVLLSGEELDRLTTWYQKRQQEELANPYSQFLFSVPRLGFPFVPQETLFPVLHQVMREVTKDETLRFHHLRHSFASWTFFRLMSSDIPNVLPAVQRISGIDAMAGDLQDFRRRLYLNQYLTRRHVYACTSLLGHSGPDVSLEHYIHFADVLLAAYLDNPELAPRLSSVVAASYNSTANAYALGAQSNPYKWIAHLWKKRFGDSVVNESKKPTIKPELISDGALLDRVWRLIEAHQIDRVDITELSQRFNFEEERIRELLKRAEEISTYRPTGKEKKPAHRFEERIVTRHPQTESERTCLPNGLRLERDRRIAVRFTPRVITLAEEDPQLSRRVFGYFIAHVRDNFSGMIFKDVENPEAAADLLNWLRKIGVKASEIRLTGFDAIEGRQRSRAMGAWRLALKISGSIRVEKRPPLNSQKDWACPWLGIDAVFPEKIEADSRAPEVEQYGAGTGAFRFIWVMGAIVFGYTLPAERVDYRRRVLPAVTAAD